MLGVFALCDVALDAQVAATFPSLSRIAKQTVETSMRAPSLLRLGPSKRTTWSGCDVSQLMTSIAWA